MAMNQNGGYKIFKDRFQENLRLQIMFIKDLKTGEEADYAYEDVATYKDIFFGEKGSWCIINYQLTIYNITAFIIFIIIL